MVVDESDSSGPTIFVDPIASKTHSFMVHVTLESEATLGRQIITQGISLQAAVNQSGTVISRQLRKNTKINKWRQIHIAQSEQVRVIGSSGSLKVRAVPNKVHNVADSGRAVRAFPALI